MIAKMKLFNIHSEFAECACFRLVLATAWTTGLYVVLSGKRRVSSNTRCGGRHQPVISRGLSRRSADSVR